MSFRTWLSIATLTIVGVVIFFSRHELFQAWQLLSSVNIWVLLLLIPAQLFVYFVGGETMFSYLRAKGSINHISSPTLTRMALEMNFVNHILPSGGVSGISYMSWLLGKYGIPPGRATMAQLVRFTMTFLAYIVWLLLAVLIVTIDGSINRWIIFVSFSLVFLAVLMVVSLSYMMGNRKRMWRFSDWLVRFGNRVIYRLTFRRKRAVLKYRNVERFFTDMYFDYRAMDRDKRILVKPLLWGLLYNLGDVALFLITFWAMGISINPAPVLIAYGVAAVAGMIVATPGGAGVYEAIMVGFLALAGLSQSEAIAGIVLTRVILLIGTIALGYVLYQKSIIKYGKFENTNTIRQ